MCHLTGLVITSVCQAINILLLKYFLFLLTYHKKIMGFKVCCKRRLFISHTLPAVFFFFNHDCSLFVWLTILWFWVIGRFVRICSKCTKTPRAIRNKYNTFLYLYKYSVILWYFISLWADDTDSVLLLIIIISYFTD